MIPVSIQAALWGLTSGGALVIGAVAGYAFNVPARVIALVMAFGSGVLVSALCFEIVAEAHARGGFGATAVGFAVGAVMFTAVNLWLGTLGARHRKRSGDLQVSEKADSGSGLAIAAGALLDGIPESIVIGVSLIEGGGVGLATVAAIFLSNLPEGLSSASGMRRAGRSKTYVFGVWGGIAVVSAMAAFAGYTVFQHVSPQIVAATTAVAAGAILTMVADTMIPEAFAEAHSLAGLATAAGFLVSFGLSRLAE